MSLTHSIGLAVAVGTVAAILSAAQGEPSKAERVYSVCEVLANLASLNGKIISVRGTVTGGGHGAFLSDNCSPHVVINGFTWPDAIWLTFPLRPGTPFHADLSAYKRAQAAAKRLRRHEGDEIVMTHVGMLETDDLATRTFVDRRGKPAGLGFGPQNVAPAQLIVKTVKNVSVIRKAARAKESPMQDKGSRKK